MMWTKVLESVDDTARETLERNSSVLKEMTQIELENMFKLIKDGREHDLGPFMQVQMLMALPDREFLELKRKTGESLKKLADFEAKRKALVKDLTSGISKVLAKEILLLFLV